MIRHGLAHNFFFFSNKIKSRSRCGTEKSNLDVFFFPGYPFEISRIKKKKREKTTIWKGI